MLYLIFFFKSNLHRRTLKEIGAFFPTVTRCETSSQSGVKSSSSSRNTWAEGMQLNCFA